MNTRWLNSSIFWGLVLILAGGLFMLQSLNILPGGSLFVAAAFAVGGVLFVSVFIGNREHWWALIPGMVLLSLAATVGASVLLPESAGEWTGAIFLGGMGLGFWLVFLVTPQNWWAIIPGGVLFTLAAVSGLDAYFENRLETGGVFFLGLGVTFALVGILPGRRVEMRWAYIPAFVLTVMGLLIMASAASLINYVWPAVLIVAGGFLLLRAFRRG